MTRRHFFSRTSTGIGIAALASLLQDDLRADGSLPGLPSLSSEGETDYPISSSPAVLRKMELFDYKPKLKELRATELPDSIRQGQRLTGMTAAQTSFPVAPSMYQFAQHGDSGAWLSELLPYTGKIADQLCFIKSMNTDAINHDPAVTFFQTGFQLAGRPSMGAWLSYGSSAARTRICLHS